VAVSFTASPARAHAPHHPWWAWARGSLYCSSIMHGTGTGEQDCDLWGATAASAGWTDCPSSDNRAEHGRAHTVFAMQVFSNMNLIWCRKCTWWAYTKPKCKARSWHIASFTHACFLKSVIEMENVSMVGVYLRISKHTTSGINNRY
jgi:hypothetical protein